VTLQLVGVGYKVALDGTGPNAAAINLRVGYSHPVIMPVPAGIQVKVPIPTKLVLIGADYHQLTQFAANIRSKRPPEPYNGKGIFVDNEKIVRKEGKKSK
jgi:large subunit ribosomal protein L6